MSTLSFSNIGTYGWYGNQLYQIASTIGVATKNDIYFFERDFPMIVERYCLKITNKL